MNGIEATRKITTTQSSIGVLVITMFDDDDSVFAAMRAGARGYLLKDADKDELVRAIVAVDRGDFQSHHCQTHDAILHCIARAPIHIQKTR